MAITGTRYEDEVVRVVDLFTTADFLEGYVFINCHLVGPAVIGMLGELVVEQCLFDPGVSDPQGMFWVMPPAQSFVGIVGFYRTEFRGCRFDRIGIAAPAEILDNFRKQLLGLP